MLTHIPKDFETFTLPESPQIFHSILPKGKTNPYHFTAIQDKFVLLAGPDIYWSQETRQRFIYKISKRGKTIFLERICEIPWSYLKERLGHNESPAQYIERYGLKNIVMDLNSKK
jgi:hypothetical protein